MHQPIVCRPYEPTGIATVDPNAVDIRKRPPAVAHVTYNRMQQQPCAANHRVNQSEIPRRKTRPRSGLAAHVLKGREPWSFRNGRKDADATLPADDPACKPIDYPKPDGVLSFDLLSNLALSGVKHEHDQPAHLRIKEGMETTAAKVGFLRCCVVFASRDVAIFFGFSSPGGRLEKRSRQ